MAAALRQIARGFGALADAVAGPSAGPPERVRAAILLAAGWPAQTSPIITWHIGRRPVCHVMIGGVCPGQLAAWWNRGGKCAGYWRIQPQPAMAVQQDRRPDPFRRPGGRAGDGVGQRPETPRDLAKGSCHLVSALHLPSV